MEIRGVFPKWTSNCFVSRPLWVLGRSQCWQGPLTLQKSRWGGCQASLEQHFGTRWGSPQEELFQPGSLAPRDWLSHTAPSAQLLAVLSQHVGLQEGMGRTSACPQQMEAYCILSSHRCGNLQQHRNRLWFKSKQLTTVILGHLYYIFLIFSISWMIKNKLLH